MYDTFLEIRNRVSQILNFTTGSTDQDFTAAQIKDEVNAAYMDEWNKANNEGRSVYQKTFTDLAWPASQTTFTLPAAIEQESLIAVWDITAGTPGVKLQVYPDARYAGIFWLSRNKLQWGTGGPPSAKTVRFDYYSTPEKMINDDDEPTLIPRRHRELLAWSAAIRLREIADDDLAPQSIRRRLDDLRVEFYKYLSKGRPQSDVVTITQPYPDSEVDGSGYSY